LKCVDKKEVEIGCMYVRRINKEVKEKKLKEVKEVKEEDQLDYTGTKKKTKMVNEWYTYEKQHPPCPVARPAAHPKQQNAH
jgi:hypothetical protein